MIVYILRDNDPVGGYYSMQLEKPDPRMFRDSVQEIRAVEVPDWLPPLALEAGLPIDADGSNDSTWAPWWNDATAQVVWTRS